MIDHVAPGSPAERKGLVRSDSILAIDGSDLWNADEYVKAVKAWTRERPALLLIQTKDEPITHFLALTQDRGN